MIKALAVTWSEVDWPTDTAAYEGLPLNTEYEICIIYIQYEIEN